MKKIFSFVIALVMVIPFAFILQGCGEQPVSEIGGRNIQNFFTLQEEFSFGTNATLEAKQGDDWKNLSKDEVTIDKTAFDKTTIGVYEIKVTYNKNTDIKWNYFVVVGETNTFNVDYDEDQTYASITLPTNWEWVSETAKIGDAGTKLIPAMVTSGTNVVVIGVNVIVAKIDPVYIIPTGLVGFTSTTLAEVLLPTGWTWDNPNTELVAVGEFKANATFTPEQTGNYNTVSGIELTVNVSAQDVVVNDTPLKYIGLFEKIPGVTMDTFGGWNIAKSYVAFRDAEVTETIFDQIVSVLFDGDATLSSWEDFSAIIGDEDTYYDKENDPLPEGSRYYDFSANGSGGKYRYELYAYQIAGDESIWIGKIEKEAILSADNFDLSGYFGDLKFASFYEEYLLTGNLKYEMFANMGGDDYYKVMKANKDDFLFVSSEMFEINGDEKNILFATYFTFDFENETVMFVYRNYYKGALDEFVFEEISFADVIATFNEALGANFETIDALVEGVFGFGESFMDNLVLDGEAVKPEELEGFLSNYGQEKLGGVWFNYERYRIGEESVKVFTDSLGNQVFLNFDVDAHKIIQSKFYDITWDVDGYGPMDMTMFQEIINELYGE